MFTSSTKQPPTHTHTLSRNISLRSLCIFADKNKHILVNMASLTVYLFIVVIALPLLHMTHSISDTVIYGGCSKIKYTPGSTYESNLNSLLTSLVNSATSSSYNKYTITGSTPQDIVYGLFQCRGDLTLPDCATCVAHSVSQLGTLCPQTCGGAAQLDGCFVKFDNTSFIGVEDKSVVMKKCASSVGYDTNLMDGRDAVLAGLGGATGSYRVSGSGNTQGMSQCVEDLSVSECEDCVMEAIGRLKSDCEGAVSGEMFLAKCYAKYSSTSTSGDHVYQSDHGSSDDNHSDGEQTFAIVIGVLAGVILLVIFLTFLGRVFGGNAGEDDCEHKSERRSGMKV
ncbi:plasmodesmata-located protein 7-like [Apium graveolens]|uniref:plasmodesmata-located protein 7-like n=1 Tax=Apium graveolens TaxID=4045 RepID=UPI003D792F5E